MNKTQIALATALLASVSTFTHAATCPVKQLAPGLFLVELFHGPSLAFKDVAMQLLGRLYEHALQSKGRTLTIICATSGDTGGAAVEAFRGRANVRIVALFPEGRISEVQRRFMTTATDANVRCLSIQGSFDDCQNIVKASFSDDGFRRAVDLSGVNSINWARIAAQSVYYFTAAAALGAPARAKPSAMSLRLAEGSLPAPGLRYFLRRSNSDSPHGNPNGASLCCGGSGHSSGTIRVTRSSSWIAPEKSSRLRLRPSAWYVGSRRRVATPRTPCVGSARNLTWTRARPPTRRSEAVAVLITPLCRPLGTRLET